MCVFFFAYVICVRVVCVVAWLFILVRVDLFMYLTGCVRVLVRFGVRVLMHLIVYFVCLFVFCVCSVCLFGVLFVCSSNDMCCVWLRICSLRRLFQCLSACVCIVVLICGVVYMCDALVVRVFVCLCVFVCMLDYLNGWMCVCVCLFVCLCACVCL